MKHYIETNKERFFEELFSLLRIPSVSSLEQHRPDMQRCAERLVELLTEAGADEAAVYPTAGHPVVFGQKIIDPSLPTVLVYGHYDVQPVDPISTKSLHCSIYYKTQIISYKVYTDEIQRILALIKLIIQYIILPVVNHRR